MKRRTFLLGAAAAGVATWSLRPRDEGAPYTDYFRSLNDELRTHGPMRPCLVVDLDRVDRNVDTLTATMPPSKAWRIVAKSLPSLALIRQVADRAGTNRVMAFHQPFLSALANDMPGADVLVGKPMPVRSAAMFYEKAGGPFDPERQLQWLVDSPERLDQYHQLARLLGTSLRVNVEIDVGLHRGGVADGETLDAMLARIEADPEFLTFAGFMGYDPHVVKLPRALGSVDSLFAEAVGRYRFFLDRTRQRFPKLWRGDLVLNGAGSPTYPLHDESAPTNDLGVGSAIVKPTDFDIPTLEAHVPASFIATPVLKKSSGVLIPGLERLSGFFSWWNPNRAQTFFIYGGFWKAKYESPAGLLSNSLYGHSSNQEMVNGSQLVGIDVDDHVFLRPTQSESVFLQFGDLVVVRGGRIVDRWPVLPA